MGEVDEVSELGVLCEPSADDVAGLSHQRSAEPGDRRRANGPYLAFIIGVLNIVGGFGYASGLIEQAPLPNGDVPPPIRTGPMIDRGMYMAAAALALGTLAEIGMSLRRVGRAEG